MKESSLTEASATPATIGTRARAAYETVDSQWNAEYTIADRREGEGTPARRLWRRGCLQAGSEKVSEKSQA